MNIPQEMNLTIHMADGGETVLPVYSAGIKMRLIEGFIKMYGQEVLLHIEIEEFIYP